MTAIDQEISSVARALGIDAQEVQVRTPEWLELMRRGVIVELHLRRWRAFGRLTAEHLGIYHQDEEEKAQLEKSMRLGEIYLLPAPLIKALGAIDSGARKSIERYAYKTYWGYMLTPDQYLAWKKEADSFQARYLAIRDKIQDEYLEIMAEVASMHSANARSAYRRAAQQARATGQKLEILEMSEAEFVQRYVDAVVQMIPSAATIYESFDFQVDLEYIPLPSLIASDQADVEIQAERVRTERAKSEAELKMHQAVTENYRSRMNELVIDHLGRIVGQLNSILYDAASDVLSSLGQAGSIHPRSVVQLRGAIEKIRAMNILDYPDIERMISQAETALGQAGSRNVEELRAKLTDIAVVTRDISDRLGEIAETRSGRAGNFYDKFSAERVRESRERLGLSIPAFEEDQRRAARAG